MGSSPILGVNASTFLCVNPKLGNLMPWQRTYVVPKVMVTFEGELTIACSAQTCTWPVCVTQLTLRAFPEASYMSMSVNRMSLSGYWSQPSTLYTSRVVYA